MQERPFIFPGLYQLARVSTLPCIPYLHVTRGLTSLIRVVSVTYRATHAMPTLFYSHFLSPSLTMLSPLHLFSPLVPVLVIINSDAFASRIKYCQ